MQPSPAQFDLGQSLLDEHVIEALGLLCGYDDGLELRPSNLPLIERGLRAFLTGKKLVASRLSGDLRSNQSIDTAAKGDILNFHMPFEDHLLDYEFILPESPQSFSPLGPEESAFLQDFVLRQLNELAGSVLPVWVTRKTQAEAFYESWFKGDSLEHCVHAARYADRDRKDIGLKPYDGEEDRFDRNEPPLFQEAFAHARYLIGCQRAGAVLYANSPMASICSEHIFTAWPEHLFSCLDDEYRASAKRLRGPGIFVTIPPLTKLVMSRASMRHKIPEVIRDMREEYARARDDLWEIISQLYFAETETEQRSTLRLLEQASKDLFGATWPEKFDVLSFGLTAASLTPDGIASAFKSLHDHNKPYARVSSITFARKLSKDLRRDLLNQRELMQRHLSLSEQSNFGFV
jgi:hypothetical protein